MTDQCLKWKPGLFQLDCKTAECVRYFFFFFFYQVESVTHTHPDAVLFFFSCGNIQTHPPNNQQQKHRGQFPETCFQVAGIIYRPTWSLSHLQHHRVSAYLVTEASIILLLCIPAERERGLQWLDTSLQAHFPIYWPLPLVSLGMMPMFI